MKSTVKKILLILSAAMLFAVVLCFNASALGATGECGERDDDYTYPVTWSYNSETKELVISGKGYMMDFGVNQSPFCNSDIRSVVIEDGVRNIGESAFWGCKDLGTVILGKDVSNIGEYAFEYTDIFKITVLNKKFTDVREFSEDVIIHCYKDSAIYSSDRTCVLIDGTEEDYIVGGSFGKFSWTLDKRTGLLKINGSGELPPFGNAGAPWDEYENYILQKEYSEGFETVNCNCDDKIRAVILPSTVRSFSFWECESLESVVIPEGITSIGNSCFEGCTNLENVTIPNSVTVIEDSAFSGCKSLKSVELPEGITEIGSSAFWGCESIEKIDLPNNLKSIGYRAFIKCKSLESISIPDSVIFIDYYAFEECRSLKSVKLPENITVIADGWFWNSGIEGIDIPLGVKEIGSRALQGKFESITIPFSVKKVGEPDDGAFDSAFPSSIKEIVIFSRDCEISKHCGFSYLTTFYGYKGSTAEKLAEELAATFVDIETIHKTHEYISRNNADCCSYEVCVCGAEKAVKHTDKDKDAVCDNCKRSVNHINVGEAFESGYYRRDDKIKLKYTAPEAGIYTFKASSGYLLDSRITVYDESGNELASKEADTFSYELDKGQTVYWQFSNFVYNASLVTCTLSVEHKHSYEKVETKKATCTSTGEMTYTCSCGDSYKEEISKGAHKEATIKGKEATCTKAGLTDGKKCTVCGEVTAEQTTIPATGHMETNLKAVKATYTKTGLTAGKKCKICGKVTVKQKKVAKKKLKKVTVSSVKSTKAKTATVTWKKTTDASGYVVEYSTSKKFTSKTTKKVTIKKGKTTKTNLKKLKSGKKYYVRVKAYRTEGKKTVYGAYSSVKSVKVK